MKMRIFEVSFYLEGNENCGFFIAQMGEGLINEY
ncbi:hypothetical protein LCGC14_0782400 [marine sediment metagenome]|uniref:Uncharacterized protein n=1 Tax=marine sediment metagenome TaxID=412755 RepID=A0A0F9PZB4_9ZZZZ